MSNTRTNKSLLKAAKEGNYLLVKDAIISRGADANFIDDRGNTALMMAVYSGNLSTVQYLLSLTKDIEAQNKFQTSALDIARGKEDKDCIKLLKDTIKEDRIAEKRDDTKDILKDSLSNTFASITSILIDNSLDKNKTGNNKSETSLSGGLGAISTLIGNALEKKKTSFKAVQHKTTQKNSIQTILKSKKIAKPKRRPRP